MRIKETQTIIVTNMINNNYSVNDIMKITGLKEKEIKSIIKKI